MVVKKLAQYFNNRAVRLFQGKRSKRRGLQKHREMLLRNRTLSFGSPVFRFLPSTNNRQFLDMVPTIELQVEALNRICDRQGMNQWVGRS